MDRKIYKLPFRKESPPQWVCPTCGKGTLKIKQDTFTAVETWESKKDRVDEEWNPQWTGYVYSCLLVCSNQRCKEAVVNSGEGFVDVDWDFDDEGEPEQN